MFKNDIDDVAARRVARLVFGAVLIAGAAVIWGRSAAGHRLDDGLLPPSFATASNAVVMFAATWGAAVLTAAVARRLVRSRPRPADWLLRSSLIVPSIGIALVLPLTLHMPFALLIGGLRGFDDWVAMSLWITAPAHAVLAILMVIRAAHLADGRDKPLSGKTIYLTVIVVSAVPYAILMMLPPVLVMLTGLAFLPVFRYQAALVERERAATGADVARSTAVFAHGAM